jgi:hypothetical protein
MAHIDPSGRVAVTTINKYIRKAVEPVFTRRKLLAALRAKGRISFNNDSHAFSWLPRFRRITVVTNDDMQATGGQRTNLWKKATLPYRSLRAVEVVSKHERLANRGPSAIIKILGKLIEVLSESIMLQIADDLYNDGESTSSDYGERLHGFESWHANTGSRVSDDSGTGLVADPNDTYATLSTALDAYGSGDWTPDSGKEWPTGKGDPQYCFWSPLQPVYNYNGWGTSAATWIANWLCCLRFAKVYMEGVQNRKLETWMLNSELYRQALDYLNSHYSININRGPESTMTKLGFEAVTFEDMELTWEYGVPTTVGYGIVWDALELMSMQGQLIEKEDDTDFDTQVKKFGVDFFGNMRIETPAWSAKVVAL